MCKTFKDNPIESVELGEVFESFSEFRGNVPTIPYKLTLEDGSALEGELHFYYKPQSRTWWGYKGLDWHLEEEEE